MGVELMKPLITNEDVVFLFLLSTTLIPLLLRCSDDGEHVLWLESGDHSKEELSLWELTRVLLEIR